MSQPEPETEPPPESPETDLQDDVDDFLDRILERNTAHRDAFLARQESQRQTKEQLYGCMFRGGERYRGYASAPVLWWVVEGLLPQDFVAVLGATSKAGKTCFATALAMSVATGRPFLGMPVAKGAVLWCAYEESPAERRLSLTGWPEFPGNFYVTHERPLIDDDEGIDALRYWIAKTGAKLVVIDPLYGATSADSLADGLRARRALQRFKDLCAETHVCGLLLHHLTKDVHAGVVRERFADSHQILAVASMDMLMTSDDMRDGGRLLRIACRGRGDFANQTLYVRSSGPTDYQHVPCAEHAHRADGLADSRLLEILAGHPKGTTAAEIAREARMQPSSVRNRLTNLLRDDRILTVGHRRRAVLYAVNTNAA